MQRDFHEDYTKFEIHQGFYRLIPTAVYEQVMQHINNNLTCFHCYTRLDAYEHMEVCRNTCLACAAADLKERKGWTFIGHLMDETYCRDFGWMDQQGMVWITGTYRDLGDYYNEVSSSYWTLIHQGFHLPTSYDDNDGQRQPIDLTPQDRHCWRLYGDPLSPPVVATYKRFPFYVWRDQPPEQTSKHSPEWREVHRKIAATKVKGQYGYTWNGHTRSEISDEWMWEDVLKIVREQRVEAKAKATQHQAFLTHQQSLFFP